MVSKSFEVDISEIIELADFMSRTAQFAVRDELTNAMLRSNVRVEDSARELINRQFQGPLVGARTGESLTNSFRNNVQVKSHSIIGIVKNVAKHAHWVNFGRGPVYPKRRKFLRFVLNGRFVFRKSAGPAMPQYFMERGLQEASAAIQGEFAAAARKIAEKIGARKHR